MASSFSQGDAFISSKPERTTTFTSSPPSRREERQQSIAVLPPPSTMTRLPMRSMWPKETLESQSMPMWMFLAASLRPGMSRSRPRGAPQPTKIGVEVFRQQRLHAVDALAADELDAEVEDVVAFLVEHVFRQAEFRNLRAHHAAGQRVLVEHHALIAYRRKIARHGQRGWAAAYERNALAVFCRGRLGQAVADVILEVGGDALEPADRDRLFLDPAAPARRLAGAVAGAAEHAREYVRFPVDHVGVAVAACGDQTDVFGHRRVRRASPLTVDDLVEIIRNRDVGRFH